MVFHRITVDELEALQEASNYRTLDISMFSMCAGVFATLIVTLLTVSLDKPLQLAGFIAATSVFGVGSVLFGFRARIAWRAACRKLEAIREPQS